MPSLGGAGILTLDCRNAFNEVHREVFLRELVDDPKTKHLWRWVHGGYGAPSKVLYSGDQVYTLYSSQECQQGDPLGPIIA